MLGHVQSCFVHQAQDWKWPCCDFFEVVRSLSAWQRSSHSLSPFCVYNSVPLGMSLKTLDLRIFFFLETSRGDPAGFYFIGFQTFYFRHCDQDFRQQTYFLMGKENPLDWLCLFLAETAPIKSEGSEKSQKFSHLTQRGQRLTKDSLSLLNLTHRKPPGKINCTNSLRLRKKELHCN